mmetsp:Transcript_10232/g.30231  ORF Transcript_10232/g.30231 Transcript_10232/m.30231 type:complete len:331 (-) Transcript_10232:727-1719(-)
MARAWMTPAAAAAARGRPLRRRRERPQPMGAERVRRWLTHKPARARRAAAVPARTGRAARPSRQPLRPARPPGPRPARPERVRESAARVRVSARHLVVVFLLLLLLGSRRLLLASGRLRRGQRRRLGGAGAVLLLGRRRLGLELGLDVLDVHGSRGGRVRAGAGAFRRLRGGGVRGGLVSRGPLLGRLGLFLFALALESRSGERAPRLRRPRLVRGSLVPAGGGGGGGGLAALDLREHGLDLVVSLVLLLLGFARLGRRGGAGGRGRGRRRAGRRALVLGLGLGCVLRRVLLGGVPVVRGARPVAVGVRRARVSVCRARALAGGGGGPRH